jgi:hypothetical protein
MAKADGKALKEVVAHSFRLRGDKAAKGMWAAEMKAAKELMEVDSEIPADVAKAYTAPEIIGCLDALHRQGVIVKTLRLLTAAPRILTEYIANPSGFVAPAWLEREKGDKRNVKPPPNF